MTASTYVIIAAGAAVLWIIMIFNNLVAKRQAVEEAWATIDTQLKRRYDLIPNLVETAKGYAKHESATLDAVIKARNAALGGLSSRDPEKAALAEGGIKRALGGIFALGESYPALKANENFAELQRELSDTETKIQAVRQFYNTCTMSLNTSIESFPGNVVAGIAGFKKAKFFEAAESEKAAPKVSF